MPQRREGEAAEATAAPAGRKTLEVVSGAERIADALALVAAEAERVQARFLCKRSSGRHLTGSTHCLSSSEHTCDVLRPISETSSRCLLRPPGYGGLPERQEPL